MAEDIQLRDEQMRQSEELKRRRQIEIDFKKILSDKKLPIAEIDNEKSLSLLLNLPPNYTLEQLNDSYHVCTRVWDGFSGKQKTSDRGKELLGLLSGGAIDQLRGKARPEVGENSNIDVPVKTPVSAPEPENLEEPKFDPDAALERVGGSSQDNSEEPPSADSAQTLNGSVQSLIEEDMPGARFRTKDRSPVGRIKRSAFRVIDKANDVADSAFSKMDEKGRDVREWVEPGSAYGADPDRLEDERREQARARLGIKTRAKENPLPEEPPQEYEVSEEEKQRLEEVKKEIQYYIDNPDAALPDPDDHKALMRILHLPEDYDYYQYYSAIKAAFDHNAARSDREEEVYKFINASPAAVWVEHHDREWLEYHKADSVEQVEGVEPAIVEERPESEVAEDDAKENIESYLSNSKELPDPKDLKKARAILNLPDDFTQEQLDDEFKLALAAMPEMPEEDEQSRARKKEVADFLENARAALLEYLFKKNLPEGQEGAPAVEAPKTEELPDLPKEEPAEAPKAEKGEEPEGSSPDKKQQELGLEFSPRGAQIYNFLASEQGRIDRDIEKSQKKLTITKLIGIYKRNSGARIATGIIASAMAGVAGGEAAHLARIIFGALGGATAGEAMAISKNESQAVSLLKDCKRNEDGTVDRVQMREILKGLDKDKMIELYAQLTETASAKALQVSTFLMKQERKTYEEAMAKRNGWLEKNLDKLRDKYNGLSKWGKVGVSAGTIVAGVLLSGAVGGGAAGVALAGGIQMGMGAIRSTRETHRVAYEYSDVVEELRYQLAINPDFVPEVDTKKIVTEQEKATIKRGIYAGVGVLAGVGLAEGLRFGGKFLAAKLASRGVGDHQEASGGRTESHPQHPNNPSGATREVPGAASETRPVIPGAHPPTPHGAEPTLHLKDNEHYFDHEANAGPKADQHLAEVVVRSRLESSGAHLNHDQFVAARDHLAHDWQAKGYFNHDGSLKISGRDLIHDINGRMEGDDTIDKVLAGDIPVTHSAEHSVATAESHAGTQHIAPTHHGAESAAATQSAEPRGLTISDKATFDRAVPINRPQINAILGGDDKYLDSSLRHHISRMMYDGHVHENDIRVSADGSQIKLHIDAGTPNEKFVGHELKHGVDLPAPKRGFWDFLFGGNKPPQPDNSTPNPFGDNHQPPAEAPLTAMPEPLAPQHTPDVIPAPPEGATHLETGMQDAAGQPPSEPVPLVSEMQEVGAQSAAKAASEEIGKAADQK